MTATARSCPTITVRTEQWMGVSTGWAKPLGASARVHQNMLAGGFAERLGQRWVIDGSGGHHGASAHGDQVVDIDR